MEKLTRYICNTILVLHITFSFLYFSPDNPLIDDYKIIVRSYIGSLFAQDWRFFVKLSNKYNSLIIKCDKKKDWIDPTAIVMNKHYSSRLLSTGKEVYIYRAILKDLIIEIKDDNQCKNDSANCEYTQNNSGPAFQRALLFSKRFCPSSNIENISLAIATKNTKPFSARKDQKVFMENLRVLEL